MVSLGRDPAPGDVRPDFNLLVTDAVGERLVAKVPTLALCDNVRPDAEISTRESLVGSHVDT